jgi:hypothetical protein
MCSPRAAGFAEWRLDRLERVIKRTDAQRAKFNEFKAASNKATETMHAASHFSPMFRRRWSVAWKPWRNRARRHAAGGEGGAACA